AAGPVPGEIICSSAMARRIACALIRPMISPATPPSATTVFRRAALVGRHVSPGIAEPLSRLAAFLATRGLEVVIEAETARSTGLSAFPVVAAEALASAADVAIVVGG